MSELEFTVDVTLDSYDSNCDEVIETFEDVKPNLINTLTMYATMGILPCIGHKIVGVHDDEFCSTFEIKDICFDPEKIYVFIKYI